MEVYLSGLLHAAAACKCYNRDPGQLLNNYRMYKGVTAMYGKKIVVKPHSFHGCELELMMRPPAQSDIPAIVAGLQYEPVTRGTLMLGSPDEAFEEKWLERTSQDKDSVHWVVEVNGECIALTGINFKGGKFIGTGTTGKINFAPQKYWGKRIATVTDMVRTWYGWYQHGLTRYTSEVFTTNPGSWKSLLKSGYYFTGVHSCAVWSQGTFNSEYLFEWTRPDHAGERSLQEFDLPWMDKEAYRRHVREQQERAALVLKYVPDFIVL
ncbi:MAG: hypothetical protein TR69_WS6001000934 [candidate division WS6 bacterium OLB20]|uniref:N-acetyltransferase domain-containing protein n=1 Tax=candidate division WS6 bacterium OLB20 TaxID=1617426 RepID=A0A136LZ37_9BACT|nr:MAG: hypothetical protein TR69_WS6001000934 [candidate division WS6 bacterium OLB20]